MLQEKHKRNPWAPPPSPNPRPPSKRTINEDIWPVIRPPKREYDAPKMLTNNEIQRRTKCMKKHQHWWKKYSVGGTYDGGRARFAICSLCGARHALNDVIITKEDIERMRRDHG